MKSAVFFKNQPVKLRQHIRFLTRVASVVPVATTGSVGSAGWIVTTADGRAQYYDGVFVANGHLHDQRIPDVPGTFTGKQIHSGSYGNTSDIDGDRVLVIGSGNSGCDIAVDAAQSRLTTAICVRRGHFFQPKTFFGVPVSTSSQPERFASGSLSSRGSGISR